MANLDLAASPVTTFDPWSQLIVTYSPCGVADLARIGRLVSTHMASAMTAAVIDNVTVVV